MKNFERKFIDTVETDEWQIETDSGWSDIKAVGKTIEYDEWILRTEMGFELICADTHIVFDENMDEIFVKDIIKGDKIQTKKGLDIVTECYLSDKKSNMFDIQINDTNHRFWSNDILSHNSMWLGNIAANSANIGFNVAFITVEMGWRKVMKRLGAMRFKVNVDNYNELSKDSTFIKTKINQLKNSSGLFNTGNLGKVFVKKFNTGSCTVTDIDNYLTKLEEIKKIKLDVVVIDYINLMSVDKINKEIGNNLYLKGKHLAEGLRYLADKFNVAVITATQLDKSVWGANDVKLADIPESKAVAETADCVWGIIRNNDIKRNNKYRLKILKLRDGEHKGELISFDFHPKFLTMNNDSLESFGNI
jgi:replicative DNA helicase